MNDENKEVTNNNEEKNKIKFSERIKSKFKKEPKEALVKDEDVIKYKVKLSEKIALKFKKFIVIDNIRTFLVVAILFVAYIALNLCASQNDLPKIDITENQIYSITDTSKKALEKVNQEVKIYAYGFDEKSTLIDLLKKYNEVNNKITYEVLTEESNYEMVSKYELSQGYYVLIIKSGESEKVIDASTEFSSYDYTTYQTVDTTEQTITNSILGLISENKPKIYITQGHEEYQPAMITRFTSQLTNEAYEVDLVNLATTGSVPEDCDILAIISPAQDFLDSEVTAITDYINKGGEIFFTLDVFSKDVSLPNLQKILDLYGVSIDNGYVFEMSANQYLSGYNYIYMPQVSSTSEITRDIYTDSFLWLVFTGRLNFQADEVLQQLNVTKETLLSSTEESIFVTDLAIDITKAVENATLADGLKTSDVAAAMTKKITAEDGTEKESKLIIIASANFMSDTIIDEINQSYPISFIGSNLDFVLNSMAYLGGKDNILTIRKEYNSSTYTPTTLQHIIVVSIIIFVPLLIILVGIIIGSWRKRRK